MSNLKEELEEALADSNLTEEYQLHLREGVEIIDSLQEMI